MVLTRSLVSVTHRSLYLVSSDDLDVREERRKRFFLLERMDDGTIKATPAGRKAAAK